MAKFEVGGSMNIANFLFYKFSAYAGFHKKCLDTCYCLFTNSNH